MILIQFTREMIHVPQEIRSIRETFVSELTKDSENENLVADQLKFLSEKSGKTKYGRFLMGIMGAIPWIGNIITASAAFNAEIEQGKNNELVSLWLEIHKQKFSELSADISSIISQIEHVKNSIEDRINSEQYLAIVRKAFRSWDHAESKDKRKYICNLIANSAATDLCEDDVIRLFNDWIDLYHEAHFKVIREIYTSDGISRGEIWDSLNDSRPREDSSEADLFKMLIRDLSTGGVIRQSRRVNSYGQFAKDKKPRQQRQQSGVYESAFEDTKSYVLTELGQKFIHYTMNEVVTRLGEDV